MATRGAAPEPKKAQGGSMIPSSLKKLAMGIVPYGDKGGQGGEDSDSEASSHSTFNRVDSNDPGSPAGSPVRSSSNSGAPSERTLDEESILNGWVRRYYALQQQVGSQLPTFFGPHSFATRPHADELLLWCAGVKAVDFM